MKKSVLFVLSVAIFFLGLLFGMSVIAEGVANILVIGNSSCGKTQFCRVLSGSSYKEDFADDSPEQCYTLNLGGEVGKVNLWDTISLEFGYDRVMELARYANIIFVLHDALREANTTKAFEYIYKLHDDLKGKLLPDCKVIPICVKGDMCDEKIDCFSVQHEKLENVFRRFRWRKDVLFVSSKNMEGFDDIKRCIIDQLSQVVILDQKVPDIDPSLVNRVILLKKLKDGKLVSDDPTDTDEEKIDENWYDIWKKLKY